MDGLREQHAAAVARFRAASRLIVVALRPPVRHYRRRRDQLAEARQQLAQLLRRGTKAMLQNDSEFYLASALHQPLRPLSRDFDGLLEQDVLAGGDALLDQLEMRIRRREDEHRADRRVGED